MALFKGQLFFEAPGGEGWSETYWGTFGDGVAAITELNTLLGLRLGLMTVLYKCVYAKVHNTATGFKVFIIDMSTPQTGTYTPTGVGGKEHKVEEAILVRKASAQGTVNHTFLHAIGTWVSQGDTILPEATWNDNFAAYRAELISAWLVVFKFAHGLPAQNEAIASVLEERVTTHHVGRPFAAARGRRLIRA